MRQCLYLWNDKNNGILQIPGFEKLSHYDQAKAIDSAVTASRHAGAGYITSKYPDIMDRAAEVKEQLHNK